MCPKCEDSGDAHECPYRRELSPEKEGEDPDYDAGRDCTCCDECTQRCADGI